VGNSNRGRKKAELRERVDYDDNNNTRKQYGGGGYPRRGGQLPRNLKQRQQTAKEKT
jgi:hypothetical protein